MLHIKGTKNRFNSTNRSYVNKKGQISDIYIINILNMFNVFISLLDILLTDAHKW